MARIYLDAWGVKRGPHGIARYCRSLVPAIVAAAPEHDFVIVRPRRAAADDRLVADAAVPEVELPLPQTDWATLAFRPLLESTFRRHGRPDLYHSLFHMLPLGLRRGARSPGAVVVTLHDLIAIDFADQVKTNALQRTWATRFDRFAIPYALRNADHVVCVSEATRQRATEWVPLERSTTVHSAAAERLCDTVSRPPGYGASRFRSYVAAMGVARPYKNAACIVRAVGMLRQKGEDVGVVLIGGAGAVPDEVSALGDGVIVTPRVADDEYAALIRSARLFVVPSRAEGFGLPLLEAMAIGTPVAASDIPVLREVGGDAALWFDPDRPDQLAAIISRVVADDRIGAEMVARGRARARGFTWRKTAEQTVAVYDRVMA